MGKVLRQKISSTSLTLSTVDTVIHRLLPQVVLVLV
jgi:hypothetical protein